jgi:hypothetical protein
MSLDEIIANYITQQRSLGKRYLAEGNILKAFRRSIGDVPVRDIRPEMVSYRLRNSLNRKFLGGYER